MRYEGDFISNFNGALNSGDIEFQQDLILDQVANLIDKNPKAVQLALQKSNVKSGPSKRDLIDATSKNLYSNPYFQKELALQIGLAGGVSKNYSNVKGDNDSEDTGDKKSAGLVVSSIASAVSSISTAIGNTTAAKQQKKVEEEKTKQALLEKIFGESGNKKKNLLPVVIIGSVLLIATVVLVITLRDKK